MCRKNPGSVRSVAAAVTGLFFLLLMGACGGDPSDEEAPAADSLAVKVYDVRPERVVGVARLEPEEKIVTLYPTLTGRVTAVNVRLGDAVSRGAVLVELDHAAADARIARIEAQIREQESRLPVIRADIGRAGIEAERAEAGYRRVLQVFEQGADTRQNLDDADFTRRAARQAVESLQAQLANAETTLGVLRADLRLARVEREDYFVRAPADGRLLTVDVAPGFLAGPQTALGQVAPRSATVAVTEVDELFAGLVHPGQPAFVRRQGAVDTLARGQVIEVAPALTQKSLFSDAVGALEDRRVREVRIRLTRGADSLLYGARVEAVIEVR